MAVDSEVVALRIADRKKTIQANIDALAHSAERIRDVSSSIRSGWRKVSPLKGSSIRSARELTTELIRDGASFVSPVLKDSKGRDVFITQRIWVVLPYKMAPAEKTRILTRIRGQSRITLESSPVRHEIIPEDRVRGTPARTIAVGDVNGNELYGVDVSLIDGIDILDEIERLAFLSGVVSVEPNVHASGTTDLVPAPNDEFYDSTEEVPQWYLWDTYSVDGQPYDFGLNALGAWDRSFGYSSIKVAVLDDGIQIDHPDLIVSGGKNFTDLDGPNDYGPMQADADHGTSVAGLINATINNEIGIAGLAPNVRLYSLKIFKDGKPTGEVTFSQEWIVDAINWCAANKIRVTNSSWALNTSYSAITLAFNNTMNTHQIVHFAASGNNNVGSIRYPASVNSVIAVGATDPTGQRWVDDDEKGSSYGTGLELMAPGSGIRTTDRVGADGFVNGDYVVVTGTSAASPLAAATAALILSKNPGLTAAQVKSALKDTARNLGSSTEFGSGLVVPTGAIDFVAPGIFYAAGFADAGDGKKSQAKFGSLYDESFPYYYHVDHGWQYTTSTNPNAMWAWDYLSNSWWSISIGSSGSYPYVWRASNSKWYWYAVGSRNPRWFLDVTTNQWVNF